MMTQGCRPAALVALLFLVAAVFVATRFISSWPIDTDILSLLPGDQQDPVLAAAIARGNDVASNRIALLVEGGSPALRQQAAVELSDALAADGLFQPSAADGRAVWDWAFAHRDHLLCRNDRKRLQQGEGSEMVREILAQWYSPFSVSNAYLLKSDPMLLTPRYVNCLIAAALPSAPLQDAELVFGSITTSVFRLDIQDQVMARIDAWYRTWGPSGVTLARAGAVFHAAYGAAQARTEMSVIGGITIAVILALYMLIFRTLRPPLLAVALIVCCLVTGLAATLAVFDRVHIMVMVFAAALIGMVVDYTTYYLLTGIGAPDADASARRRTIWRPLTVGMATSVAAFAALLASPISAFREIAVFGGTGLAAAWLATLFLLPTLEGRVRGAGPVVHHLQLILDRLLGWTPVRPVAWIALTLTAAVALGAWLHGSVLDDVRRFQAPSSALMAEEQQIRTLTGFAPAGTFFLVTGPSRDQATAHEEVLVERLHRESPGRVAYAASTLAPSDARAAADRALLRQQLLSPHLSYLQQALGAVSADPYAALDAAPQAPLPGLVAALRGQTGSVYWSILPLIGNTSGNATGPTLEEEAGTADWTFVDPADRYSKLLARYRIFATVGLFGAAVTTGLVLLLVYRRLAALWIMLPTALAMILTPAITTLAGLPFSFFSAMGLFLVVGAGVDYGVFQWEYPASRGRWTRVGIALAAAMTCVSVGLLGLSSVLPVMSFGITVALGIFLSLALSPLVRCGRSIAPDSPKNGNGITGG